MLSICFIIVYYSKSFNILSPTPIPREGKGYNNH